MSDKNSDSEVSSDGLTDAERAEIKQRSQRLGEKIDQFTGRSQPKQKTRSSGGNAFGHAMKMAIDPIVGVLFGLGVGLFADNALGTKPLFLMIGLLLGGAAGTWNLIRSASTASRSIDAATTDAATDRATDTATDTESDANSDGLDNKRD